MELKPLVKSIRKLNIHIGIAFVIVYNNTN